jgi:predicted nucleic acid-binding protein
VADSTPLIHLSRMSSLDLLRDLFRETVIPPRVFEEVVIRGRGRPGTLEVASASCTGFWITETVYQTILQSCGEG